MPDTVSDADCIDEADDTRCSTGFSCTPLMRLGEQCCHEVCACNDDLAVAALEDLARDCAQGDVPKCCDRDPRPAACGS